MASVCIFAGFQVTYNCVFFFQFHSLIVRTQLHIIMMLSCVVIFHFGDFIFIFVVFGKYTLDEYVFFFPNLKTRINFLIL
jgi:hypothetical protein